MRNITRKDYEPKIGDYHNMIVHDPVRNKIWLFDCDGVYLNVSKTYITVRNEGGDSETDAISQAFVTKELTALKERIAALEKEVQELKGGA